MIFFAVIAVVDFSFPGQQVDDALEGILCADWELHSNSFGMKTGVDGLYCMQESAPTVSILLMNAIRGTW